MNQSLLSVKEVSSFLHVHPKTLYKWTSEGKIPYVRINGLIRFKKQEIESWQEKYRKKTAEFANFLPKFDLSLENYDKMLLKGRSALSKKSKRWNYGFGSIYIRKTKQGKERWYVDYWDASGKRIQRVVKKAQSREDAVIALREKVFQVFSKEHNIKLKQKKIKLSKFADVYLHDYAESNKKSWKTDRYYLRKMKEILGDFYLDEITSQEVERFKVERLKQEVAPSTVNRCLAILRKMLNLAVEWDYLNESQLPKFRLFSEKDNLKERILTIDEEKKLLESSSKQLKPILVIALNTGMRLGEILNLHWNQIDDRRNTVRVEKTKSGKIRFIHINSILVDELLRLKATSDSSKFLFVNPRTRKPLTTVKTAFKGACRRAGIKGLRFHDLRHTFASRLVEKGVDLITVKELLGHSSVKITERYTHSNQQQKQRAVELLAEKRIEKAANLKSLLRLCDMDEMDNKDPFVNRYFSVN